MFFVSSISILIAASSPLFVLAQVFTSQGSPIVSSIVDARIKEIGINQTLGEFGLTYDNIISFVKNSLVQTLLQSWINLYISMAIVIALASFIPYFIGYHNSIEIEVILERLVDLRHPSMD